MAVQEILDRPVWVKGKQAGWDDKRKRWRRIDGRFTTETLALEKDRLSAFSKFGGFIERPTEESAIIKAARAIEYTITGQDPRRLESSIVAPTSDTDPIPSDILAMMQLAEYYTKTEGDVEQTISVPLQIGLRELRVSSTDKGVETQFQELYDELDMEGIMEANWFCTHTYGQSFPLEVYEKEDPVGIYILNPKKMEVGRTTGFGRFSIDWRVDDIENWVEQLKRNVRPEIVFRSLGTDFDEHAQDGQVPLNPQYCHPIHALKAPFQRYAIPPLARAYRSISTRQVLEELIRATIEGHRNQLWVFRLGDENTKVSPQKMQYFQGLISGSVGDRTGYLVWTHDLQVDVYTPNALDSMMGNERWQAITAHIFRQLGISTRVISGEAPMGSSRTGEELDIKILLARLEYVRRKQLKWLEGWNRRYIERQPTAQKQKLLEAKLKVHFGEDFISIEEKVKGFIQPLVMTGKISDTTTLEKLGLDYDTELSRKQDEEDNAYLFTAQPTYAQVVPTKQKNIEYTPEGRPPENTPIRKPIKVAAAQMELPEEVQEYEDKILAAYDDILASENREIAILSFADVMRSLNNAHINAAYIQGYSVAGGGEEISQERINQAIKWNNDFLDNFIEDLLQNTEDDGKIESWRKRARLYAREGHKRGFMMGIFQAMIEQGARGWKRILHPELSKTGPCAECIADSRLMHPITVEFWEPHPHGVCTRASVYFYRGVGVEEIPIGFPVPDIEEILGKTKHITRRVR